VPALRTQDSLIKALELIGQTHGYAIHKRQKDPSHDPDLKKFLPDLIAQRHKGKTKLVFEVETTVTNNTIFKSLLSLLTALSSGNCTQAYLVVPERGVEFTEKCFDSVKLVIKRFGKKGLGAYPKVHLDVLSAKTVTEHNTKAKAYLRNGRKGQPPKCPFMPRAK
jgi:hypothetical protein